MKSPFLSLSFAFIALLLMGSGKRESGSLVSMHIETSKDEYPKFAHAIKMGDPAEQFFFQTLPVLTDRDFVWFYPFIAEDKSYGTAFKLNKRGTDMLKSISLTPGYSGKLMAVYVMPLGKKEPAVQSYLQIDRPISDGIIVIWKGLSEKHLTVFAKQWPHVRDVMNR